MYVTDYAYSKWHRIQKFDGNGAFIASWGGSNMDGVLYFPRGIAVGPEGTVYVANIGNSSLAKMTPTVEGGREVLYASTKTINQQSNVTQDYVDDGGVLNVTGKLVLEAVLKNSLRANTLNI